MTSERDEAKFVEYTSSQIFEIAETINFTQAQAEEVIRLYKSKSKDIYLILAGVKLGKSLDSISREDRFDIKFITLRNLYGVIA